MTYCAQALGGPHDGGTLTQSDPIDGQTIRVPWYGRLYVYQFSYWVDADGVSSPRWFYRGQAVCTGK